MSFSSSHQMHCFSKAQLLHVNSSLLRSHINLAVNHADQQAQANFTHKTTVSTFCWFECQDVSLCFHYPISLIGNYPLIYRSARILPGLLQWNWQSPIPGMIFSCLSRFFQINNKVQHIFRFFRGWHVNSE